MQYFLAIDIGASSGRHILGHLEQGRLILEEVYRFPNGVIRKNGHLCWDLEALYREILNGLKQCKALGKIPAYLGIDTWGVDFVLLDAQDQILGDTVAYRDSRTTGTPEEIDRILPREALFRRTGIQPQVFNAIYQLYTMREVQKQASCLLFVPEYFNFLLTGVKMTEYTFASTSGLLDAQTKDWDWELLELLGFQPALFGEIHMPGCTIGHLTPQVQQQVGFDATVVLPALHDTGSAVLAVPTMADTVYISSGTWSLMGVESPVPRTDADSLAAGLTNEGGYDGRYRYLKNIMGLWMIQSVRHEYGDQYSFDQLCTMAQESQFPALLDVNDNRFLAPASMIDAICDYCRETGQPVPETPGDVARCIYISLAKSYAETVEELERFTGKTYPEIHIVGGGSKDVYLNRLTAAYTGRRVITGPTEATAVGNLLVQMIAGGAVDDLAQGRQLIADSLDVKEVDQSASDFVSFR